MNIYLKFEEIKDGMKCKDQETMKLIKQIRKRKQLNEKLKKNDIKNSMDSLNNRHS